MDDILGEESDNESEGRGKDKVGPEEAEEEEERQQEQLQQQHPGAGQISRVELSPQAPALEERIQTPSSEAPSSSCLPRWETMFIAKLSPSWSYLRPPLASPLHYPVCCCSSSPSS